MSKRYRDVIAVDEAPNGGPQSFQWRGGRYRVNAVMGHWREDASWWQASGLEVPQRDLWRVEARNGTPRVGVYDLVHDRDGWRLHRVWD